MLGPLPVWQMLLQNDCLLLLIVVIIATGGQIMPTKKNTKWSSSQVRQLISEILEFQNDSLQSGLAEMSASGEVLSREQTNSLIVMIEPTLKDAAFKVLASKKL